jgi:hypothetical protein
VALVANARASTALSCEPIASLGGFIPLAVTTAESWNAATIDALAVLKELRSCVWASAEQIAPHPPILTKMHTILSIALPFEEHTAILEVLQPP